MNTFLRKVRIALTPRSWLLASRLSNGAVVYGRNRPGYGGRGVYLFRDAIEPELAVLDKFLEPSGMFVDIGANTGVYTLKAAKHLAAAGGTVVALEPFPEVFATLCHSVRKNRLGNVRVRNFCAGKRTGATQFWMNYAKPNSFSLLKRDGTATALSALQVALDDLIEWEGLRRLDYVKIDAEGAESDILAGGQKSLAKYRPIVQLEVNKFAVSQRLVDYARFKAPHSSNEIWFPNEHPRRSVALDLGWRQID